MCPFHTVSHIHTVCRHHMVGFVPCVSFTQCLSHGVSHIRGVSLSRGGSRSHLVSASYSVSLTHGVSPPCVGSHSHLVFLFPPCVSFTRCVALSLSHTHSHKIVSQSRTFDSFFPRNGRVVGAALRVVRPANFIGRKKLTKSFGNG